MALGLPGHQSGQGQAAIRADLICADLSRRLMRHGQQIKTPDRQLGHGPKVATACQVSGFHKPVERSVAVQLIADQPGCVVDIQN